MFYLYYEGDEHDPIAEALTVAEARGKAAARALDAKQTVVVVGASTKETVITMTVTKAQGFKAAVGRLYRAMDEATEL